MRGIALKEFLLNLLLTFGVYTLPIIIFRYWIRKSAFSIPMAKRIAIIYGIAVWILMSLIFVFSSGSTAGGSVLIWSYINYKILVTPRNSDQFKAHAPVSASSQHETVYDDPLFVDFCTKYLQLPDEVLIKIAQNGGSAVCRDAAKYTLEQRASSTAVSRKQESTTTAHFKSCSAHRPNHIPKVVKEVWPLLAIVAIIICLIIATSSTSSEAPNVPTSPDSGLTEQTAYNGEKFVVPTFKDVCPLTVSIRGEQGYYIYLKYLHAPAYSEESREEPESYTYADTESDLAFYVSPSSSVKCKVPIGVYRLYYATGDTWYGRHDLFGSGTMYFTSDELLNFYADSEYYNGTTLELWRQTSGNFETEIIDAADFPS